MKPRPSDQSSAGAAEEARRIDALYGLEPVFEPAEGTLSGDTQLHEVHCPYCGESFQTLVDASAGEAAYIEDCQVCCQPIELSVQIDEQHGSVMLRAARSG